MAFSVFEDGGHSIYVMDESEVRQTVAPAATRRARSCPDVSRRSGEVQTLLGRCQSRAARRAATGADGTISGQTAARHDQPAYFTAGVSSFGTYVSGGISMSFSDMLGDRLLGMSVQAGGTFADIGGALVYVNRQRRWNWMAAIESLPYRSGVVAINEGRPTTDSGVRDYFPPDDPRPDRDGVVSAECRHSHRVQRRPAAAHLRAEVRTRDLRLHDRQLHRADRGQRAVGAPLYLADGRVALVNDTALFGATSPIFGARSRLEVGQSLGTLKYTTVLADVRRTSCPKRPVTIAVRASQYSRWGRDSDASATG